jgi:hypothetical protein
MRRKSYINAWSWFFRASAAENILRQNIFEVLLSKPVILWDNVGRNAMWPEEWLDITVRICSVAEGHLRDNATAWRVWVVFHNREVGREWVWLFVSADEEEESVEGWEWATLGDCQGGRGKVVIYT